MWPIFISSILTIFEVKIAQFQAVNDERWESNLSLYCTADSATVARVEQQSIAVLHSRQCHCSTDRTAIYPCTTHHIIQQTMSLYTYSGTVFVQIMLLQPLPLCTSSNRPLQYNLYNQYNNTQLLNLSLCCNCTAICAMLSFTELYSNNCWVLPKLYHS